MIISRKRFQEEIAKALNQQEEKRYLLDRINDMACRYDLRFNDMERMLCELEKKVNSPISLHVDGDSFNKSDNVRLL